MYKTAKPTTYTLPLTRLDEFDALSKELAKKMTAIVKDALEMYMDYHDLKVAQSRSLDTSEENSYR